MSIEEWMNKKLPSVVERLQRSIAVDNSVRTEGSLDFAGRQSIYDALDGLLISLFPGCYGRERIGRKDLTFFLSDTLRHVCFILGTSFRDMLHCFKEEDSMSMEACEQRAEKAIVHLLEALPDVRITLHDDIQAAFDGDPAAKSFDEIVLSYPCIEAIATHRIAHILYQEGIPVIPRIMAERAHSRTGIDIHPGAKIGGRFFIDHGTGVVIGETSTIGYNVKIYQGVTLGALSFPRDNNGKLIKGQKRHPDIEDNVVIYANATILGGSTVIGKGSIIGGNAWITQSVPAGSVILESPRSETSGTGSVR